MFTHSDPLWLSANPNAVLSTCDKPLTELSRACRKGNLSFLFLLCRHFQAKKKEKKSYFPSQELPLPATLVSTYTLLLIIPEGLPLRLVEILSNFDHVSWELPMSLMRSNCPLYMLSTLLHFTVFFNTGYCRSAHTQTHF